MNLAGRVGADMKIGIGSNLTLEATINPDFGQIEADPAEVNLTVFETIFDERRPFFIEGNSVLVAGTSNYYYSRRIGARPTGAATGDYVDYPDISTILGAAKLTGRFKSGTSVGFLGAVTDEESAQVSTTGLLSNVEVAPRTAWGVGRVIQEFGKERSTVGAHLTRRPSRSGRDRSARRLAGAQRDHDRRRHAPAIRQSHLRSDRQHRSDISGRRAGRDRARAAREHAITCSVSISRRFGSIRRGER